ncbi:uncharacterized protein PAC_03168 [Phialocephala subalpina]|uniref:Wax synthase domain-containing protein n=1 Tax=Phialocephala subalpina TaxID=576137 RepID=A0A1L7WKK7_9HELO|nr:uncharacterized protein PAC_03168 [Phialocephala subalpina]
MDAVTIFLTACQRMLTIPATLFIALMLPRIFYCHWIVRALTLLVIYCETAYGYRPHKITNIIISYLMGFGGPLMFIRSANLLLFTNPRNFQRLRKLKAIANLDMSKRRIGHEWEPFPEFGLRRAYWILDLLFNLRGIGWSYRKPLYPVPRDIQTLYQDIGMDISNENPYFRPTRSNDLKRSAFFKQQFFLLITRFLMVDLCINLMDRSQAFQGFQPPLSMVYPVSTRSLLMFLWNGVLGTAGVYSVMDLYGSCIALVSVGLLGPNVLGTWGEPFMYPRLWGPLWAIWDDGLMGMWSPVWHDLFKHIFQTFSRGLVPEKPDPDFSRWSYHGRSLIRMQIVFLLSGICHGGASHIQLTHTYPILTFIGFTSQAIGIALQILIDSFMETFEVGHVKRKAWILLYSLVWAFFTMYVFLGDLAASGAFKLKLVPFSVVGLLWGRPWPGWQGS